MRQALVGLVLFGLFGMVACGGSKSSSTSTSTTAPASISVTPSSISLNQTDVVTVTGTVVDSNGAAVTSPKPISFTSSNTSVATVNPSSGSLCAGTWDTNFVHCTPGQVGTATITLSASNGSGGTVTGTSTVYVHQKVDRVTISTPTAACKSMGQTLQLSAVAYSNGTDVTSTIGPFNWIVSTTSVATIDSTGLVTAQAPGTTQVYASTSNVVSPPVTFSTCAAKTVTAHVSGSSDTSFTFSAASATQQLAADVVDTAGNTISPTLSWVSLNPAVAGVDSNGLVTAVAAGSAAILAECTANCNYNLPPVYGNTVVITVSGTSASTAYATGTNTTQLIPIDTTTNTAGTAITLPSMPNSFRFQPDGLRAFLGSSGGLITLDPSSNSISQNTAIPGKVLAVSPDSNLVIVADASSLYVQNAAAGGGATTLPIAGATAAAFTPDSAFVYIVAGTTLYTYGVSAQSLNSVSTSGAANDIAVLPSGAFVVLANGAPHTITATATCDASSAGIFPTPGAPTSLAVTPDAKNVVAVDPPNIDVLTRSSLTQPGCPPPLQAALHSVDLGQGAFTPAQLVLAGNGATAYIASNLPEIIAFNVAAQTASTIPLANGANGLSESLTMDGASLYVGGSDKNVHRIDTAAASDAKQISVTFTPDLVAVRPK